MNQNILSEKLFSLKLGKIDFRKSLARFCLGSIWQDFFRNWQEFFRISKTPKQNLAISKKILPGSKKILPFYT